MKMKTYLFYFFYFIFLSEIHAQDLIIYEFNERIPDYSDKAAGLIIITFYPDGLIKSYEKSYFETGSKTRQVSEAFKVIREGNTITQKYSKNMFSYKTATFHLGEGIIFINRPEWEKKAGIKIEKRKKLGKEEVAIFNEVNSSNKVIGTFKFASTENNIEYINDASLGYSIDELTGVPNITVNEKKETQNTLYKFTSLSKEKTLVTAIIPNGPQTDIYRIEGRPRHAQPEIAIINFYLFAYEPGFGLPIFPYIGGSPVESK